MKIRILHLLAFVLAFVPASALLAHEARDPANADAPVPDNTYIPVLEGYEGDVSLDRAGDWRELNDLMGEIGGPAGQLREQDAPLRER